MHCKSTDVLCINGESCDVLNALKVKHSMKYYLFCSLLTAVGVALILITTDQYSLEPQAALADVL